MLALSQGLVHPFVELLRWKDPPPPDLRDLVTVSAAKVMTVSKSCLRQKRHPRRSTT